MRKKFQQFCFFNDGFLLYVSFMAWIKLYKRISTLHAQVSWNFRWRESHEGHSRSRRTGNNNLAGFTFAKHANLFLSLNFASFFTRWGLFLSSFHNDSHRRNSRGNGTANELFARSGRNSIIILYVVIRLSTSQIFNQLTLKAISHVSTSDHRSV